MKPGEWTAFIGPKGLKPCPLCGGPASVFEYTAGVIWTTPTIEATRIGCDRCGLEIRGDGAARAWNTRAERTCRAIPHDNLNESEGMGDAWEVCSECGALLAVITDNQPTPNYCPNCGAKVVDE